MLSDAAGLDGLCVAVDVWYPGSGGARAALVGAPDAGFGSVVIERVVLVPEAEPYRAGEFYLRELPAIRAVLSDLARPVASDRPGGVGRAGGAERPGGFAEQAAQAAVALIVVDGYVDLDPDGRPGLGAHVYAEFGVPVIGVAKSAFATAVHAVPVRRGASARPLFVTAAGLSAFDAARTVQQMAGRFRLPDALRRVDALARGASERKPVSGDLADR